MPEKAVCPICGWAGRRERVCPVCGWKLFSEEYLLLTETEAQAEAERLTQAQKQWQDAIARFQKGEFGSNESAFTSLRIHLEQLGFQPGPAFEAYARRYHPSPFSGTAFLGVQVHGLPAGQEAEITLNGYPVGTTQEGYLALRGLRAGHYRLEASTPTHFAATEVEISEGAVLRQELTLKCGKGRLRILSLIGGVTVEIGKQSIPAPCEIEVEAGVHTVILKRKEQTFPYSVTVRRREIVELNIARLDPFVPLWVRHTSPVRGVAFSPDGKKVASGSEDNAVRLWDVSNGQCIWVGKEHKGRVYSVAFSPDGRWVVSGSGDYTMRLWDVSSGQCIWVGKEHTSTVRSVTFSPDGRWVISGGDDGTIRLWDVASWQCIWVGKGHKGSVSSVAFSPDGRWVASGGGYTDSTVRLWDVSTGQCKWVGKEHKGWVYSIVFSQNGRLLASGGDDSAVRLWDVSSGRCIWMGKEHKGPVYSVAFSPDGKWVISGSYDSTMRLWGVSNGWCVWIGEGHKSPVFSVAFSPNGRWLISGGYDGTVRLWDMGIEITEYTYPMPEEESFEIEGHCRSFPERPASHPTRPTSSPVKKSPRSRSQKIKSGGA